MSFSFCRQLLLSSLFFLLVAAPGEAVERPAHKLNRQAVEQMQQGNYSEAVALLKGALQKNPDNEVIVANMGQAYLGAGDQLISQSRYAEAIELLEEGKEYANQESRLWLFRGLALLKTNDYLYAESELNEAWAMSGDEPQVLWLLGRLYYDTDRVRDAVDAWERALQLNPDNALLGEHLGRARKELAVEEGMEKGFGSHFIITYDGDISVSLSNDILDALEDAYDWVGYQLGHYPQRQVPVLIYAGQNFKKLTNSPDWASGLYDGKIRLPAGGLDVVDAGVKGLLFHEFMHVVVREMAGNKVPFWLNEGLAEVATSQQQPLPLEPLHQAAEQGLLFNWGELEKPVLQLETQRVVLAYLQSYSFVRFLLDEYGWFTIQDLLQALGRGIPLDEAIDQTLGVYAVDFASLQQSWAEDVLE